MKKFLLLVFSVVALVCTFAFCASAEHTFKQDDIISFGSYPQSKVTDSSLISKLNSQSGSWVSYNYYIEGKQSDFMKYKDVTYNGNKYRAVTFSKYRPYSTGLSSSYGKSVQGYNGYETGTTYWFKYESLKWKVLDPAKDLVMCTSIIDSQDYYPSYSDRTIGAKTIYANNWEYSTIRTWLNNNFYNTAFTSTEKRAINSTTITNKAYSTSFSLYDANNTTDKVYLLSWSDVQNTAYGFVNSRTRTMKCTDYAKAQGLYVHSANLGSIWRLRTAGDDCNYYACYVGIDGSLNYSCVYYTDCGILPALNINLKSSIFQSHSFTEKSTASKYLKSAATCTKVAVYYYKCSVCDAKGTKTFTNGPLAEHKYTTKLTKATTSKDGKSYKLCSVCNVKSGTKIIPKIKTVALSATTYTCNNSERKPSVTVKDTKGKVLKKGTDYSVSYSSGRIKPGTYTVTVTFKGNYSGSKKLSFKIGLATVTGLKQTSGKGLCLTWNKVPGATGYIIQQYISSEKKYKNVKTVSTNSYKNSKISKGVTAKVRIIATYGSVKSSPSSAISAKSK